MSYPTFHVNIVPGTEIWYENKSTYQRPSADSRPKAKSVLILYAPESIHGHQFAPRRNPIHQENLISILRTTQPITLTLLIPRHDTNHTTQFARERKICTCSYPNTSSVERDFTVCTRPQLSCWSTVLYHVPAVLILVNCLKNTL